MSSVIAAAISSGVEAPEPVDADDRELAGLAPARVEHARVLDRGGDDARRRARPAAPPPQIAWLTASVPLAVNTTSRGRAPNSAATCSRASSTATRVTRPSACRRAGSPWCSREEREHRLERGGPQRRGRRVVEVRACGHGRESDSDAGDAVVVAVGPARLEDRLRVAVEPGHQPADQARGRPRRRRAGTAGRRRRTGSARRRS